MAFKINQNGTYGYVGTITFSNTALSDTGPGKCVVVQRDGSIKRVGVYSDFVGGSYAAIRNLPNTMGGSYAMSKTVYLPSTKRLLFNTNHLSAGANSGAWLRIGYLSSYTYSGSVYLQSLTLEKSSQANATISNSGNTMAMFTYVDTSTNRLILVDYSYSTVNSNNNLSASVFTPLSNGDFQINTRGTLTSYTEFTPSYYRYPGTFSAVFPNSNTVSNGSVTMTRYFTLFCTNSADTGIAYSLKYPTYGNMQVTETTGSANGVTYIAPPAFAGYNKYFYSAFAASNNRIVALYSSMVYGQPCYVTLTGAPTYTTIANSGLIANSSGGSNGAITLGTTYWGNEDPNSSDWVYGMPTFYDQTTDSALAWCYYSSGGNTNLHWTLLKLGNTTHSMAYANSGFFSNVAFSNTYIMNIVKDNEGAFHAVGKSRANTSITWRKFLFNYSTHEFVFLNSETVVGDTGSGNTISSQTLTFDEYSGCLVFSYSGTAVVSGTNETATRDRVLAFPVVSDAKQVVGVMVANGAYQASSNVAISGGTYVGNANLAAGATYYVDSYTGYPNTYNWDSQQTVYANTRPVSDANFAVLGKALANNVLYIQTNI